jgi:hypothetical protein
MFVLLAVILGFLWIGGFLVMHISSAAVHLLLILAVASLFVHFFRGRSATHP